MRLSIEVPVELDILHSLVNWELRTQVEIRVVSLT